MDPHEPPLPPVCGPNDPAILDGIEDIVRKTGVDPDTLEGRQVSELMQTAIKLIPDGRHAGELKLMNSAMKELRYAYSVFAQYASTPKISIFGSARTPEDHPDYREAVVFARQMAEAGWMVITGAGDGIMKAGHEGPGPESSFGVAIRLPFETSANEIIAGDEKLINFRYFFTRKLIFVSQSDAVALFPGGFGTQDENFETLTLIQTGKSQLVPVVMMEGGPEGAQTEGGYWQRWDQWVHEKLLGSGWISPEDPNLYYLARDSADAAQHVAQFYRVYHSSRYVRDKFVLRLKQKLTDEQVEQLNEQYSSLVESGRIMQSGPLDGERDFLDLPRLTFHHTRRSWGKVRQMLDLINSFGT